MEQGTDFWGVSWKFEGKDFDNLLSLATETDYPAQQLVFSEGDQPDGMYLVTKGFALVMKRHPQTKQEQTIAIVEKGQSFGEMGLLVNHQRMATIAAGTDLKVIKITDEILMKLEKEVPELATSLYKTLAQTLAKQLMSSTSFQSE